jgi:hypothetical protein
MADDDDDRYEEMAAQMDELIARQEARTRAVQEHDFIAKTATEHWTKDGIDFFICESPVWPELKKCADECIISGMRLLEFGRWNGYARFPKLPGILPGRGGIYSYVPVHGGITYFQEWANGSVTYGFDCAHGHSSEAPIDDIGWIKLEAESMARGIQIAARFERYYLNAGDSNEKKLRVLTRMEQFLPLEIGGNMGVMLNILKGEL